MKLLSKVKYLLKDLAVLRRIRALLVTIGSIGVVVSGPSISATSAILVK